MKKIIFFLLLCFEMSAQTKTVPASMTIDQIMRGAIVKQSSNGAPALRLIPVSATSGANTSVTSMTKSQIERNLFRRLDSDPQKYGLAVDASLISGGSGSGITDGDKGDITVAATGATWTIDNNVVDNVKAADMPALTIKGNNGLVSGNPKDLTRAETTTLIDVFAGLNAATGSNAASLKGSVPAPPSSTTGQFLSTESGGWRELFQLYNGANHYGIGFIIRDNNRIYRSNVSHIGNPTFDAAEQLNWTELSPSTGGTGVSQYDAGGGVMVSSSGSGTVTATKLNGEWTVTIPAGTNLINAHVNVLSSDIQTAADGAGSTNWVRVTFNGTQTGSAIGSVRLPSFETMQFPVGAVAITNTIVVNTVSQSFSNISAGTLTARKVNLSTGNNYVLSFSNF